MTSMRSRSGPGVKRRRNCDQNHTVSQDRIDGLHTCCDAKVWSMGSKCLHFWERIFNLLNRRDSAGSGLFTKNALDRLANCGRGLRFSSDHLRMRLTMKMLSRRTFRGVGYSALAVGMMILAACASTSESGS